MRALAVMHVWVVGSLHVLLFVHDVSGIDQIIYERACSPSTIEDSTYELYTRTNPYRSIFLKKDKDVRVKLEKKEKNVFIIHGYEADISNPPQMEMKNAYLVRYDANVIMMNWSMAATGFYPRVVYCNMPLVSKRAAQFLCSLNIPLDQWHLVGHSLGAHLSGFIGENTIKICGEKIDRITGLDPAGPLFTLDIVGWRRLNQTDANFVDVIHTSGGVVGYYGNCGHVDFHVNCGTFQNGCENVQTSDVMDSLYERLACDHSRSIEYMIESINSANFVAQSCSQCPAVCLGDFKAEYILMGEDCPRNSTKKVFRVPIRSISPYARGCSVFRKECL